MMLVGGEECTWRVKGLTFLKPSAKDRLTQNMEECGQKGCSDAEESKSAKASSRKKTGRMPITCCDGISQSQQKALNNQLHESSLNSDRRRCTTTYNMNRCSSIFHTRETNGETPRDSQGTVSTYITTEAEQRLSSSPAR